MDYKLIEINKDLPEKIYYKVCFNGNNLEYRCNINGKDYKASSLNFDFIGNYSFNVYIEDNTDFSFKNYIKRGVIGFKISQQEKEKIREAENFFTGINII